MASFSNSSGPHSRSDQTRVPNKRIDSLIEDLSKRRGEKTYAGLPDAFQSLTVQKKVFEILYGNGHPCPPSFEAKDALSILSRVAQFLKMVSNRDGEGV